MWVSTKPGSTSLPPTSISTASQASLGSMAAIRPPETPISTGMGEVRVRALRKIRSKAVFAFMGPGGLEQGFSLAEERGTGSSRLCAVYRPNCSKNVHAIWWADRSISQLKEKPHVRCRESRDQSPVGCRGGGSLSDGVDDPGSRCGRGL